MSSYTAKTTGDQVVQDFGNHLRGKTILVTGASVKGLGAGTAITLARGSPAQIVLLARSAAKVDSVISAISSIDSKIKTDFVALDLGDLSCVRKAAAAVCQIVEKIDILINNAGIMAVPEFTTSTDGIELQLATNHVGHFLFTNLLMNKILAAGKGSRIVNLTSDGHTVSPFRFDDYNFSNGAAYDMWSGYGQSKTANILFTKELASKLKSNGVVSFAVHPGVITTTGLGDHLDPATFGQIDSITMKNTGKHFEMGAFKSTQEGIATTIVAALDPWIAAQSGAYLEDCIVHNAADYASSAHNAGKLWELSETLVGQSFDY